MSKELIAATERELADWPGATMTQDQDGGKHGRISIHFGGVSRLIIIAKTPSDVRAMPNHLALVRRELRGLGAERARVIVGKPKAEVAAEPIVIHAFKEIPAVAQPKKTDAKIAAILNGIEDLRYGEMIEFCAFLRDIAGETKLRRSDPHSWAKTLQCLLDMRDDREAA